MRVLLRAPGGVGGPGDALHPGEVGGPDYPIFVNGEVTYLPRGKPIDVTPELVEMLDRCGIEYAKG